MEAFDILRRLYCSKISLGDSNYIVRILANVTNSVYGVFQLFFVFIGKYERFLRRN